jgi:hypothetical protein
MNEQDYPSLYQVADVASIAAQKHYSRSFLSYGALAIIGAALSIAGLTSKEAACVAALVFIGGLFVSIYMALMKNESIWYKARAVAESVKTATWRFMMRAEPFDFSLTDVQAREKFKALLKSILYEHKDLAHALVGDTLLAEQLSARMVETRSKPLQERKTIYMAERIQDQKEWYVKKSKYNKGKGTIWFWSLVLAQAIAVTLAILRIVYPGWQYWPTEIFIVAGSSILGWIQLKRFRELAASYALAAQEIGIAQVSLNEILDEPTYSTFVRDTENAFSREHTQWIAKKE